MKKVNDSSRLELRIREAIRNSGLSLSELAENAGVHHGQLSRFLRGHRTLTLPAAGKICEVLGLELKQSELS